MTTELLTNFNKMEEKYYEIIPKDDDPEVAIVLDRITDSAKKRIDFSTLKEALEPFIDSDFFVYETLCRLNNNEEPEIITASILAEIMMQGFVPDNQDFIAEAINNIKDNCKVEMYALQLAVTMIFAHGDNPTMVLANLERFLI